MFFAKLATFELRRGKHVTPTLYSETASLMYRLYALLVVAAFGATPVVGVICNAWLCIPAAAQSACHDEGTADAGAMASAAERSAGCLHLADTMPLVRVRMTAAAAGPLQAALPALAGLVPAGAVPNAARGASPPGTRRHPSRIPITPLRI